MAAKAIASVYGVFLPIYFPYKATSHGSVNMSFRPMDGCWDFKCLRFFETKNVPCTHQPTNQPETHQPNQPETHQPWPL